MLYNLYDPILCAALVLFVLIIILLYIFNTKITKWLDYYTVNFELFFSTSSLLILVLCFLYFPIKSLVGVERMEVHSYFEFLNFCILFPFCMEIIVNGFVQRILKRLCSARFAIAICSAILALSQSELRYVAPTVLIFIPICLVFNKTQSLLYAVFLHVMINCVIFIVELTKLLDLIDGFPSYVLCLFGVLVLFVYTKFLIYLNGHLQCKARLN